MQIVVPDHLFAKLQNEEEMLPELYAFRKGNKQKQKELFEFLYQRVKDCFLMINKCTENRDAMFGPEKLSLGFHTFVSFLNLSDGSLK